MSENTTPVSGFADTFLSKLKEQSFTIIVMVVLFGIKVK